MNTLKTPIRSKVIFLTIFGIAMGFLEAVVVVYLRQLYYPEGVAFPLRPMGLEGFFFECLREISTIVMLISIGMVAGRIFSERLAYILCCFGIRDIFYSKIIVHGGFISRFLSLGTDPHFQNIISHHIPTSYNWHLFLLGEGLVICFFVLFIKRMK